MTKEEIVQTTEKLLQANMSSELCINENKTKHIINTDLYMTSKSQSKMVITRLNKFTCSDQHEYFTDDSNDGFTKSSAHFAHDHAWFVLRLIALTDRSGPKQGYGRFQN